MIGLHRQFQHRPALLIALLAKQVFAAFATLIHHHLPPAFGTPHAVRDQQLHMLCIAVVGQVVAPVAIYHNSDRTATRTRLLANANASPCIRVAYRHSGYTGSSVNDNTNGPCRRLRKKETLSTP